MPKGVEREGLTRPEKLRYAPGKPGKKPHWSNGAKTAVGTATSLESRVWFTLGRGTINEIYFPDIDTANTRSIRFLVAGEGGFFCDEEFADHSIEPMEEGVPSYRVTTSNKKQFVLEKEIIIDPERDLLLLRVHFQPSDESLRLFLHVDPQIQDKGGENSAHIGDYKGTVMLFGNRDGGALALAASVPYLSSTCGYVGKSDGIDDVKRHGRLTKCYNEAPEGNVTLCAEIDWKFGNGQFVLAIGLGGNCAEAGLQAKAGLLQDFEKVQQKYVAGWKEKQAAQAALEDLGGGDLDLYRVSVAVLGAHQSKRYPGGAVASLSIPWGFAKGDEDVEGYHVVWPRDLVEETLGRLACGDIESARDALFYLACTQEADGHWSQNLWLDGTPHFDTVQMDSTALPVMLACRLHREGHLGQFDVWPMLRKATQYLLRNGPCTAEERWESLAGYSVSTMAAEVTALLASAEVATMLGKNDEAEFMCEIADAWNEAIDEYTYTQGTELAQKYGVSGHYIRIAPVKASSRPIHGLTLKMPNNAFGSRLHRAVNVVSPDALMLVRLGLRRADDPRILNTLKVIDGELKRTMSTGPGWIRSSHDGYGEHSDGAPFDGHGIGRCWPLLAGERGHYALAAGDRETALDLLRTMAGQTSSCGMLPEQAWDKPDIAERQLFNGRPTGSGMPLAWAHAEYVKLLRSLHEGRVWDMPITTRRRYLDADTRSDLTLWTPKEPRTWIIAGKRLLIMLERDGFVRWIGPDKSSGEVPLRRRALGFFTAIVATESFPPGSRFEIEIQNASGTSKLTRVKVQVR